ncbi:MAG TPA: hypothetical protein PLH43_10810 [Acetivibrio sp.]|uniref:hypothetical protein n=1 Tax=Acetivibrio sp. TaxID=1872092 RepID=UPI002B79DE3B|nr:hypothetical protein [Acetivibrio sp.]HOM03303.1 hypothetical protein [Acetivibrio sp.]
MAQFCTCGSLIINDSCTNKNCSNRVASKLSASAKKTAKTPKDDAPAKSTRTRKASKCITYNLYDKKAEES